MIMQKVAPSADARHEPIEGSIVSRNARPASILAIGRFSLSRFAWFVVLYNITVIVWGAYVRADQLLASHRSGVPLFRKASTGVGWSLGSKGTGHISRGGGHSL